MADNHTKDAILRYYEEVWNQRKLEVISDLLASSFVGHERNSNDVYGPGDMNLVAKTFFQNFSNATFTIVEAVAEGNTVAIHLYFEAVNHKTSRPVKVFGMNFFRLNEGKIVESWSNWDEYGMFQQMGGKMVFEE